MVRTARECVYSRKTIPDSSRKRIGVWDGTGFWIAATQGAARAVLERRNKNREGFPVFGFPSRGLAPFGLD